MLAGEKGEVASLFRKGVKREETFHRPLSNPKHVEHTIFVWVCCRNCWVDGCLAYRGES